MHAGKRRFKSDAFDTVSQANFHRRRVKIRHFDRQIGDASEREISPQRMVYYRSNWYIDAWCHFRNDLRSFSLDAIQSAIPLAEAAYEVEPSKLRERRGRGYGIFSGEAIGRAVLRFSPQRTRWVSQEIWHEGQTSRVLADGSLVLEFPYSDTRELIGEILRHGTEVTVLDPPELRHRVAATIQQMAMSV
jgi:hypothetical protein